MLMYDFCTLLPFTLVFLEILFVRLPNLTLKLFVSRNYIILI